MCCFTGPIRQVSGTNIFARATDAQRQLLVYAMKLDATSDVAMVLPIPVPPGAGEEAVRFIDLSDAPEFFAQLSALFPPIPRPALPQRQGEMPLQARALVVHQVGDFEASFVPSLEDFDRLDARFRLPKKTWHTLPEYGDYGFAVFKLRMNHHNPGLASRVKNALVNGRLREPLMQPKAFHPMAFTFPRRDASKLFFPTVHIHDGEVHAEAEFDHALFMQGGQHEGWERSMERAAKASPSTRKHLDEGAHVLRKTMRGMFANRDLFLDV
jgi:hypothetical protein